MKEKVKVVWICHFSNKKVRQHLNLSSNRLKFFLKRIIGERSTNYYIDFAPWITNLIKELQNYKWSDKKQDEPIDAYNHCIDAARYAITHKLKERQSQVL